MVTILRRATTQSRPCPLHEWAGLRCVQHHPSRRDSTIYCSTFIRRKQGLRCSGCVAWACCRRRADRRHVASGEASRARPCVVRAPQLFSLKSSKVRVVIGILAFIPQQPGTRTGPPAQGKDLGYCFGVLRSSCRRYYDDTDTPCSRRTSCLAKTFQCHNKGKDTTRAAPTIANFNQSNVFRRMHCEGRGVERIDYIEGNKVGILDRRYTCFENHGWRQTRCDGTLVKLATSGVPSTRTRPNMNGRLRRLRGSNGDLYDP